MQYFVTQLSAAQDQTTHTLRANQYLKKREQGSDDEESSRDSPDPQPEPRSRSRSRTHEKYGNISIDSEQLHLAGLQSDDEFKIPPPPFPHRPVKEPSDTLNVQEEIAKPPIELYDVHATSATKQGERMYLRTRHLNVLSAIMHRCLLEGDYARAGRAWGMLLRTLASGHYIDPRNHDRWGIGAEILLHRKPANAQSDTGAEVETFSEEGFELAKEYYELLIIQYPNSKANPNRVDDRSFYPAMFSLWIYQVCEKSKAKRNEIHKEARRSSSMSLDSVVGVKREHPRALEERIETEELSQAMEIAARLDQLVASPPFDRQADLLQLRGHVCLWTSALIVGASLDDEDWNMESNSEDASDIDLQQLNRLNNCQKELLQAQDFFQRAQANGALRQQAVLASVRLKLMQVSRHIAKVQRS